jgi:Single-strand binding protein family
MTEASVSFAGNLTDQPEVRYTDSGIARAVLRVAVSGRREQEASFFTVTVATGWPAYQGAVRRRVIVRCGVATAARDRPLRRHRWVPSILAMRRSR